MLDITIGGIRCKLSLLFPAVLLVLLSADRTGLAAFGFLAAIIHECGHMLVLILCGAKPHRITISFYGMRMDLRFCSLTSLQEIVLYGGGPFVNIVCSVMLMIGGVSPLYSMLHLILAVFNLLPILPLDGGQILLCTLRKTTSPRAVWFIMNAVFFAFVIPLGIMGVVLCVYNGNFTLLFCVFYLSLLKVFCKGN